MTLPATGVLAFDAPEALPADARDLLDAAERESFQLGAAWWGVVAAAGLPPGGRPRLMLYRDGGRALALLPLMQREDGGLAGLTTPYTCIFRPLAAAGATAEQMRRAGLAFGRACRWHGPVRLDALDTGWPGLAPMLAGLRQSGLVALRFTHFGNWHADVAGMDWDGYLATRPGELRQTIRRRLARAGRDGTVRFEMVTGGAALEPGIAAYEAVYAGSWKPPEPYPRFTATLLRVAAAAGVLRLSLLRQAETPVAAQYWIVAGGAATVQKLAFVESARALSPGTVLTALTIRRLLEQDRIAELDFGRGDDRYKAGWTGALRQRGGVLLCPWWQPAGVAELTRHVAGRAWRRWRGEAAAEPAGALEEEIH